jgi:cytochrome c oxidase subunit 3
MTAKLIQPMHEGSKSVHSVGMIVALVSFGMLFATLMMGFAIYRLTAPVWPPQGMVRPELVLPTLSTVTIFLSSLCFYWYEKNPYKNRMGLYLTLILGIGFMLIQSLFWSHLSSQGIYTSSGIFASIIYAFTWIHAAHIVLALLILVWLVATFDKLDSQKLLLRSMNVGKFWHFLGIVWLIMFVTIFVL